MLRRNDRAVERIAFQTPQGGESTIGAMLADTFTDGFLVMQRGRILSERDLTTAMSTSLPQQDLPIGGPLEPSTDDPNLMSTAQRDHVERVLQQVGGNKAAAARLLGISRRAVYRRLERRSSPA